MRHPSWLLIPTLLVASGLALATPAASAQGLARIPASLQGLAADQLVPVYVVLAGDPAAALAAPPQGGAAAASPDRVEARVHALEAEQSAMEPSLTALDARVVYRFQRLANAIEILVPARRLPAIVALPGVVRLDPVGRYHLLNSTSVPFIGAPEVWQRGTGAGDGKGIRIGIIDTGIDYLHADFGGSGNPADYAADDRTIVTDHPFPTAKVVGGWDFAGDAYDASEQATSTPAPDPDPLDCFGHGTHVAGTAAGYGVLANGQTYTGPYDTTTNFSQFTVGPGVAPMADLYALKIFGCSGSTNLVGPALEWAADPAHHMDVVNLSLGCDFWCDSPTELTALENLTALGTVVVAAGGNAGNTFYDVSDPAASEHAIAVAASIDNGLTSPALQVTQPPAIAGLYLAAEGAITRPLSQSGPVTGTVVQVQPADACAALTNGSAVRGKIALIDRGTCLFSAKITNAQSGGAIAVVLVNNVAGDPIVMGGDSSGITIPGVMIGLTSGTTIKAKLSQGVAVRLDASLTVSRPDLADQIADFSSRGPRSWDSGLKPDLAAPGYRIVSAAMSKGTAGVEMSGTSMATPHVSGAAALMRQVHPDFSANDVKAVLMNTARPTSVAGAPYPESRVGAGRVDLAAAANATVTAVNDGDPWAVSLSFGVVESASPTTRTGKIRLANYGSAPVTLSVSVAPTLAPAGVGLVPGATSVTVPARVSAGHPGTATVSVTLSFDPQHFVPAADPTTPDTQSGQARFVLPEATGALLFTGGAGGPTLHVPYYAVLSPISRTAVAAEHLCIPAGPGTVPAVLPVGGITGTPPEVVSAFQLGAESSSLVATDPATHAADLIAVGAASDAASHASFSDATVYFGIATAGEWTTPQPFLNTIEVHIDTNGDGADDDVVTAQNYGTLASGDPTDSGSATDTFVTGVAASTANTQTIDSLVNIVPPTVADTRPFNDSVLILPVKVASLGLTSAQPSFTYYVRTYTYAGGETVDTSPRVTFDPTHPTVDTATGLDGTPLFLAGEPITLRIDTSATPPVKVLVLHHTNGDGARAEIVTLDSEGSADLSVALAQPPLLPVDHPTDLVLTVRNSGPSTAVSTRLVDTLAPGVTLVAASASKGGCTVAAGQVTCALGNLAPSTSATVTLTVTASAPGTWTNQATVGGSGCDPQPGNNAAAATSTVGGRAVRRHLLHR
ncbi:MAG: S8 family serine peptidase [Acidobacteriota bacterium]